MNGLIEMCVRMGRGIAEERARARWPARDEREASPSFPRYILRVVRWARKYGLHVNLRHRQSHVDKR
jgi:hypothetical protein